MNDNKNLTIGILSITGVILLVAVIILTSMPQPAQAIGMIDRGGDYIIVTGQFTENSEVIYITDAAAKRMIMYSYEPTTRELTLWDAIDLGRAFGGDGKN
jgi:hypothetical protein